MSEDNKPTVEQRSIDFIPHNERYGKVFSLFTLWFGGNLQVTAIAAGAVSVAIGLPLSWALLATVLGHLLGAIFMAAHSAQGPRLGIPQMIQSRAQFGYLGAALPLVLVIAMFIGYFASSAVLNGQALTGWLGIDVNVSIVIANLASALIAIYGYRWAHASEKFLSVFSGLAFLVLSVQLLRNHDIATVWTGGGGFAWGPFLLAMAVAATWQLTYAPYVADFSRYLPARSSVAKTFWATYAGTVLASTWMFAFGATATAVAADAFAGGSVDFIVEQAGFAPWLFFLAVIAGNVTINGLNLYSCFMSTTTTVTSFRKRVRISVSARTLIVGGAALVGTVIAILGKDDFIVNFTNFIILLAYFLIPWTSINLVDFYLVRKERYNVADIFDPAGQYGGVDWRAMTAFFVGILLELPFVNSSFFVGPLVEELGGADISWILAIAVSGGVYYTLMKRFPVRRGIHAMSMTGDATPTSDAEAEELMAASEREAETEKGAVMD